MPAPKPPQRKLTPKETPVLPEPPPERTDPGGPSADVLAKAQKENPPATPGPGDTTLVYDKNKGRPKGLDAARLVVTAGPRKGFEFALVESPTTIGRGSDNVMVVPDISVSRHHVRVERQGESWVVHDQGSGNGTRVNGKPVDRYPLQHGDEIEMGDTKVQFVEPGGVVVRGSKPSIPKLKPVAPAAEEPETTNSKNAPPGTWKKRAPLYAAVLIALGILFAAGMVR